MKDLFGDISSIEEEISIPQPPSPSLSGGTVEARPLNRRRILSSSSSSSSNVDLDASRSKGIKAQLGKWSPRSQATHPSRLIAYQNLVDQAEYMRKELNKSQNRIADLEVANAYFNSQTELLLETQKALVKRKYEIMELEMKVEGYDDLKKELLELRKEVRSLKKENEEGLKAKEQLKKADAEVIRLQRKVRR